VNRTSQQQEQQASAASSSSTQSAAPEEDTVSVEEAKEGDDIRLKAYAALQQLSTKKSVRGSKRRPLDLNDLAQSERDPPTTS